MGAGTGFPEEQLKMSQVTEFLNMGGYALYVWASFGLGLVVLLLNTLLPMMREREIIKVLQQREEREHCS